MQASKAFDAVCEQLSLLYADKGWKYAKSKHWMTKKDKHLTYKIYFYTNWNNVSDQNVGLYGECAIILNSSKNKVFTIGTHHSNVPRGKLYWIIADQQNWSQAIAELGAWIDEAFMPIVHQCHHQLESYVMQGGEAVSAYGRNGMRNYSNFRTIIENHITLKV